MRHLGLIIIIAAFLAGSFLSVLDPYKVNWLLMVPVLLLGVVGLVIQRKAHHAATRAGHKLSGNIEVLRKALSNIVSHLEEFNAGKSDIPVYEARFEIDRRFREDLNDFAEARESMIHVFGIQHYADVMSGFAAGERYINRVWSASTDGYIDEVNQYLSRALDQFHEARDHFESLYDQSQRDNSPDPVSA